MRGLESMFVFPRRDLSVELLRVELFHQVGEFVQFMNVEDRERLEQMPISLGCLYRIGDPQKRKEPDTPPLFRVVSILCITVSPKPFKQVTCHFFISVSQKYRRYSIDRCCIGYRYSFLTHQSTRFRQLSGSLQFRYSGVGDDPICRARILTNRMSARASGGVDARARFGVCQRRLSQPCKFTAISFIRRLGIGEAIQARHFRRKSLLSSIAPLVRWCEARRRLIQARDPSCLFYHSK